MHVRSLLAGVGIAAVAVAVPLVVVSTAYAGPEFLHPSTTRPRTARGIAVHQEVQQYLAARTPTSRRAHRPAGAAPGPARPGPPAVPRRPPRRRDRS